MSKAPVVIRLWEPACECFCCGTSCPVQFGVPAYEDLVLHNDHDGEWGGQHVCKRCFDLQQTLTAPMCLYEFREALDRDT